MRLVVRIAGKDEPVAEQNLRKERDKEESDTRDDNDVCSSKLPPLFPFELSHAKWACDATVELAFLGFGFRYNV